jgi:NAD(P)-dependent dehydrogenase (short-subunit alcohol dehydrogenase family)
MSQPVCVLIGAGDGLGQALAKKFAAEGFALGLISRSEKGSGAALAVAREEGGADAAHFFPGDANDPESIETACRASAEQLGAASVLIYNVRGYYAPKPPLELDYSELEINHREEVVGALAAAKAVVPSMIEAGAGTVIYSSATAALRGSKTNPLYALGKFGLRALTQSMAKAYAAQGIHIVHVRLDCALDTPGVREYYGDRFQPEELSKPDDVAETYYWIHRQPRSAWSNEVELRPYTEDWTF